MTLTFTFPLPPSGLSPNARRTYWAKTYRLRKQYGEACEALILARMKREPAPNWMKARARVRWFNKDRRRRDRDNYAAMLKPAWDAMVHQRIIFDDWQGCLTVEPADFHIDKDKPRVEVDIWPEKETDG